MPPTMSLEFRRAIAVLAVDELIASGKSDAVAFGLVVDAPIGGAFAGADQAAKIDALRKYRSELGATAAVEEPARPLEIARFHYDQTRAQLRAIGRDHGASAVMLLRVTEQPAAE